MISHEVALRIAPDRKHGKSFLYVLRCHVALYPQRYGVQAVLCYRPGISCVRESAYGVAMQKAVISCRSVIHYARALIRSDEQ